MSTETETRIREIFRRAVQQELTGALRTEKDWANYRAILREATERVEAERQAFRRDYLQRLADARQIILREETGRRYDMPAPPGFARGHNNPSLDCRAEARVRRDHDARISAIQADEIDQYRALSKSVRARDDRQGQARDAFARAQDRRQTRSGPTRDQ